MRRKRAQKALVAGNKPPAMSDTIGWMVEISGERKVDYVAAQLSLTVAAIHATTEALTSALADLAIRPHIIPKLREEMIRVIRQEGWSAQGLYKMRLLDSFLKESQRMHPVSLWL
jgi:cytochrome P450